MQFIYVQLLIHKNVILFEKVNLFRRSIVFTWILLWINNYFFLTQGRAYFDEVSVFYLTNTIQTGVVAFQIYHLQNELLNILNIQLFRVKGKDWENPRFHPKWAKQCKENGIDVPRVAAYKTRSVTRSEMM